MTPVVPHTEVPADAIWCIGQHSKAERAALERRARAGELTKVRASWCGISSLKTVFIPRKGEAQMKMEARPTFVTEDGRSVQFVPVKNVPGFSHRAVINGTLTRRYLGAGHKPNAKNAAYFLERHEKDIK